MSTQLSTVTDSGILSYDPHETPSAVLRRSRRASEQSGRRSASCNRFAQFDACRPWRLDFGLVSTAGPRSVNEDRGYANAANGLFLVADGIGGHVGGAVASQLLVETIPSLLLQSLRDGNGSTENVHESIRQAILGAQRALKDRVNRDPNLETMGSTVALGLIVGRTLYLSHLGDSRVYLVRQGTMTQLTKDHSLVQALVEAGCLSAEDAAQHPLRHVITESVSAKHDSPVSVVAYELMEGDRLLFATDGLTDVIEEDMLGWTLTRSNCPQSAADDLVRQALDNQTSDNVTCLVVHVESTEEPPELIIIDPADYLPPTIDAFRGGPALSNGPDSLGASGGDSLPPLSQDSIPNAESQMGPSQFVWSDDVRRMQKYAWPPIA